MQVTDSQAVREPVYAFDYVSDDTFSKSVHDGYWTLKQSAPPLFWTPANGGHWVANSGDAVNEILLNPDGFTSRFVTIPATTYTPVVIPVTSDPPEHGRYRKLLRPFFEPAAIRPLEAKIVEWTNHLIDRIIAEKRCEFVDAISARLPVSIFMELMGLPMEKFEVFREVVVRYFNSIIDMEARAQAADEINGYLADLIEVRRADPRDDLISKILAATLDDENGPRPLDEDELKSIAFTMFVAGLDTVANGLSFGMLHLAKDAPLRQRILDDPGCIKTLPDELLRRYTVVNTRRYANYDIDVLGVSIRKGDAVLIPTMMPGWEEARNTCPHDVSVDRGVPRHGGFGNGIHVCLGIHLARLELRIFYRIWFERIGHFRLADPDAKLEMRAGTVMALKRLELEWD